MTYLSRLLLALSALIAVAVVGIFATSGGNGSATAEISPCAPPLTGTELPAECWPPYSADSPFNQPVPSAPELAADSDRIIDRIVSWGPVQNPLLGVADTESDFEHPIYYSTSGDPEYTVRCRRWTDECEIEGEQVRIPEAARPAGGGDGHMAVVDTESGWEYDFWQAESPPDGGGTIEISHGGRTELDGDGLGSNATAAYFGLRGGIIRPQEIRAGQIDHALFLTVRCSDGEAVPPAQAGTSGAPCEEFGESAQGAPPMGARLWLDLAPAQIRAMGFPRWKRTILIALHRYGGYVGDTMDGNGSIGVRLESGSSYTSFGKPDPWIKVAERAGAEPDEEGQYALDLDSGVEWQRHLKVLAS